MTPNDRPVVTAQRETAKGLTAVLWDMDGTLVDTEQYWIAGEYALVESYGGTWSDEHAHALVGNDLIVSARYIAEHGPVPLAPEAIVEWLLDAVIERITDHIPWRPGARELLDELRARQIPCALVTMSYRRLAWAVVDALPAGTFEAVIAGDDVTNGKPHPEPYLTAAARLGVQPQDCVAIEDSPTGVTSAAAAGTAVLGVQHLLPIPPGPSRTIVSSLEGWTASDLAQLLTQPPPMLTQPTV